MNELDLNDGALAPVRQELDLRALPVRGRIPAALNGTLLRNGPNPCSGAFGGQGMLAWWGGDAMLHGVSLGGGKALAYRNRWVRSRRWFEHFAPAERDTAIDSNPNVNVLKHAGVLFALAEWGEPVAIDTGLATLGRSPAHEGFRKGMTAHPKLDPQSGELIGFRADWRPPWLRYCVFDAQGRERLDQPIEVPAPAMMHDCAITQTHSILMDLNVAFDFSMLQRGHRIPIRWHDERRSRLCVIPRHGGTPAWFDIEPCFIQHVVNAYDREDGVIVMDAVRYPWFLKALDDGAGFEENPLGCLWRYEIDPARRRVSERCLDERFVELPRIDERYTGRPYRFAYAVAQPSTREMRGLVRHDVLNGDTQTYALPPGDSNSEAVFVPRSADADEGDGWLLFSVYRQAADSSEIHIIDAQDLSAAPLATIALGTRIPAGFHGAWVAEALDTKTTA